MADPQQMLLVRPPDYREDRGGAHLLVWGEPGQWLVVDDDLRAFLELFDGRRSLREVLEAHAQRTKRPLAAVEREAGAVLDELRQRNLLHDGSAASSRAPEPLRLANITVNITNRCNLRCAWCYNAGRVTDELPVDALMDGIERGRRILAADASFIVLGGEPFVDLPRMLRAVERAETLFGPPILVSTNGTLVTEAAAAALAARRVEVQVSIDAPEAVAHDAVRGPGAFDRAVAGARRLVDAGIHTILSMVYTRESIGAFEAYLDFARGLGADEARFIPMRLIGRGIERPELAPSPLEAYRSLAAVLERRPDLRPLLGRDFFSILVETCRRAALRNGCGLGDKVAFVDADGAVYPCPNHVGPAYRCGGLATQDLAEIAENSPVFARLRRECRVECYERCADCPFRRWCAGDCRGEVRALTGGFRAPSPHCDALRALIPEILWHLASGDSRFQLAKSSAPWV